MRGRRMTPKQIVALMDEYRILEVARQEAWSRVFSEMGDRTELENQAQSIEKQVDALMRRISREANKL